MAHIGIMQKRTNNFVRKIKPLIIIGGVLISLITIILLTPVSYAQEVQLVKFRSGNGSVGSTDGQVKFLLGPATGKFDHTYSASDFSSAMNGPNTYIVAYNRIYWTPNISGDTDAKWITTNSTGNRLANTALYAQSFNISAGEIKNATFVLTFAADDIIDAKDSKPVFINEKEIPCDFSSYATGQFHGPITLICKGAESVVRTGTNNFYISVVNSGGPSGIMYSAKVYVNQEAAEITPTATIRPTATPRATATPRPTATPRATATPKPTVITEDVETDGRGGVSTEADSLPDTGGSGDEYFYIFPLLTAGIIGFWLFKNYRLAK